jgi:membrane protease subunit (stomatin/prohibitin family)
MGLFDGLRHQLIDVIDWTETSEDVLAVRFGVHDNEIKNGAQLTVRESQAALVVDQGQPADQFGPGLHTLETANLPLLTKLRSWPYGFKSPFKTEVYFFSLREKLDQRWGTPQPITLRDKEFGSVQLRMFGLFSYRIADPATFYRRVSGTRELYRTEDLAGQLVGVVAGAIPSAFAKSGLPFLDQAANGPALAASLREQLAPAFSALGLVLESFVIESISLPEPLQKALNERQSMAIVGDLGRYAQYQAAQAIPEAARSGGMAGAGVGIAAGIALGNQMSGALAGGQHAQASGGATQHDARAEAPCVACGKQIDAGSAFCRHCGKQQQRSCAQCSTPAAPDATFCAKCGSKLA